MSALGSPSAQRTGCSLRPHWANSLARDLCLSKVQSGLCHQAEKRPSYSRWRGALGGSSNEGRYQCLPTGTEIVKQIDRPADFDLAIGIALAGCAFESYLEPSIEDQSMRNLAVNGTLTAYTEKKFVLELFAGLLNVEVISASGLPEKKDFLGGSYAYAQINVGESTGQTEPVVLDSNPTFHESFYLYVRDLEQDILKVRLQHEGRGKSASLGVAMFPVKALLDGKSHSLHLELKGPGGGGEINLSVRYLKFEDDPLEVFPKYDEEDLTSDLGIEGPADLFSNLVGQQQEMTPDPVSQDARSMPLQWRALAKMVGQQVEERFTPVCFIENPETDTQAWIYRAIEQKEAVVAFRGTEQVKWKDFLTDLNIQPKRFNIERTDTILPLPFGSKEELVHKGFLDAYDSIRMSVFSIVDQITQRNKEWTIYVTGHSLGGALATLCSYELATRRPRHSSSDPEVVMYNFGSPRVGNRAFADAYNAAIPKTWRITNSRDVIPTVPRLGGYKHVGNTVMLSADGLSFENISKDMWEGRVMAEVVEEISEKLKQASEDQAAVKDVAERVWANETELIGMVFDGSGIEQHMEEFYLTALKACVTSTGDMDEECEHL